MDKPIDSFNPLGTYMICEPQVMAEKVGSLFIPEKVRDQHTLTQAVVLKSGPGCSDLFEPGRIVVFRMHTESRMKLDDEEYIILDESDVQLLGPIADKKINKVDKK